MHPVWRQVALRTPGYEYVPGFDPRAVRAQRLGVLEHLDRLAEESEWTQYNHGARLGSRYFGRGTDAEGRNPRPACAFTCTVVCHPFSPVLGSG